MGNELFWRAQLADARKRRVPWHEISRAINALQAWRSHDDDGLSWITYAAGVTGYTPVALREMLRTFSACVELSTKAGVSMETIIRSIPMYALEIIGRIANIDQQTAINTIASYVGKKLSVGDLKQIYTDTKDANSGRASNAILGKKAYNDFEKSCFRALIESRELIVEEVRLIYSPEEAEFPIRLAKWMSRSKRFSPSFALVEYVDDAHRRINALDCALLQGWSEDRIVQRLIYVDFVSQSFSRFWLLVPSWSEFNSALKLARQLEISSIGLISVNPYDQKLNVLIKAPLNGFIKREALIERDLLIERTTKIGIDISKMSVDLSINDEDGALAYFDET